jgi:hypothetical protein
MNYQTSFGKIMLLLTNKKHASINFELGNAWDMHENNLSLGEKPTHPTLSILLPM